MHSFAGLIRRTPPPTFSDTAITDRHSDTTIFQLRAHWVRISWSIGSEKIVRTCAPGGSRTLDFLHARRAPYPLGQALCMTHQAVTLAVFNPLYTCGPFRSYMLDKSICRFGGVGSILSFSFYFLLKILFANTVDPDYLASALCLHCLPMTL